MRKIFRYIKKLISRIAYILIYYILSGFRLFINRKENYIAFGSWLGRSYIDNPRYFFEYLTKIHSNYKLIWIGESYIKEYIPVDENIVFCRMNSLKSIYYILSSKYIVFSQGGVDLFPINIFKDAILIHLDHGIPVKKWELDDQRKVSGKLKETSVATKLFRKITKLPNQFDYFISSSPLHTECIISAMKDYGATKEKIIASGTPRNDMFFSYTVDMKKTYKKIYANKLGFDETKKIILYAPTFRRTNTKIESLIMRDEKDVNALKSILLKHNAILIEKSHFATYNQNNIEGKIDTDNVFLKLPKDNTINIQEMLLFTDILISDYSGVFLDFTLLNRPIIHFAFDYEYYRDVDSGLYYDIDDFSAGKITQTFSETCEEINKLLSGNDEYLTKREYIRKKYLEYENGNASEIIFNHIFND